VEYRIKLMPKKSKTPVVEEVEEVPVVENSKKTPDSYYKEKLQLDLAKVEKLIVKLTKSIDRHGDELKVKKAELKELNASKKELVHLQKQTVF
jgi:septal ring factor EnvC (AmiA/AmiB activator)